MSGPVKSTMMKKALILSLILGITAQVKSQDRLKSLDSVSRLVVRYFDTNHVRNLYDLTGTLFRQRLTLEAFRKIFDNNLEPLGKLEQVQRTGYEEGQATYEASFAAATLSMVISLDSDNKMAGFLFKPYTPPQLQKSSQVPTDNPLRTELDQEVNRIIGPYIRQRNTVGVSVGIIRDGRLFYYDYGETARGDGTLPGPETLYEIGSISKTFTATLLATAVELGKVRLNDPVSKYLPDSIPPLQFGGKPVTLADLSNHTSGIPSLPSNFGSRHLNPGDPYLGYTTSDLFSFLKHFHPEVEPGTQYAYSNAAVGLLGIILQKVLQDSYEDLIEKYICHPLGMTDTREFLRGQDSSRFAKGYNEAGNYNPPWNFEPSFVAAGGIRSTVRDLLRYAQGNMEEAPAFLDRAFQLTHDSTFSNDQFTLGLGWHYIRPGEQKVLFHNGETGGYRSYLGIDLKKECAVVILSNCAASVDDEGNALIVWQENH